MSNRTVEILTNAAARVERDGLNKGGYYAGYGDGEGVMTRDQAEEILAAGKTPAVDLFGALHLESKDDRESDHALLFVEEALGLPRGFMLSGQIIVQWNDEEERTATDVANLLRKAAELAA